VADYPAPAGGCLLTDPNYSKRLRDLFDHQSQCRESELHLLKYGRHYRLQNRDKVIVGRNQSDNENILRYRNSDQDVLIRLKSQPGPIVLVPGPARPETLMLAASLCTGYSKLSDHAPAQVLLEDSGCLRSENVLGIAPSLLKKYIL
jgi:predicted ribosome quality control (RQC) complex YloA/Tae2 family protein